MADRFASQGYSLKNKLGDWIKQLLNSVIAKYRDLSVSRRSIICRSRIIDLLATNKSRYFAQLRPIIVKSLHIYIKSMHLSIILSRLIFAINRGACLWGETGGCFFEKYLLFHLSGYNNDQLVLKQWKDALNRLRSSRLDMTFSKIVTSRCALGHYFYAGPGAWAFGNSSYGDGDGDVNGKKATGSDKKNNDFARVSRFFGHFISVTVRFRITKWMCV